MSTVARAAPGYVDGNDVAVWQICPITNISAIASQNKVGFFTDPSTSYPKTGDTGYIRAVGSNISPCSNDTIGFDFFLPDGATLAIDATNPVRCYAIKFTTPTQVIEFTNNPPGFQGNCSQTPSAGTSGGLFFGYAVVAPGWQVDIRVPVRYNKQLLGLAGPPSHRLTAVAQTAWGNVAPFVPVTVYYQASFQNLQSSGIGATTATLGVNLFSYFKGGQLYVDYGTTNSFGLTTPPATVPNTALNFPSVSTSLTGLSPNTTYYWRYRFVTDAGTFNSPTQTFTTSAAPTFALTVNKNGTGSGTVTSSPTGINCGATCSASFTQGTTVTLNAVPASGSVFAGWSGGGCSGTGTCTVTMNAAQTVTATFNTAPAAGLTITAAKPPNAPTDATRNKGQSNVLMLAFTLNPSQATQLQSITLTASGSGNDSLDLTVVKLIRDANANGQIDSGEVPIASGTFSADNGTLTLTLSTPLALSPGSSQFLVAADIASSLAAHPAVLRAQSLPALPAPLLLTLLPLMLLGAWRMRSLRVGFLALALALTLAACGGGPNTTPVNKTYQINLTALSAQGNPTVSGLPISGATITVQK
ncbi:InlB B-repeat-containing protein [Meiothermus rufus]|uniref:InlB B-repeat-containing protein n=1 Tax=Meiothermus rufus TaxID=604332 RepID=UPI0012EB1B27|nr:hypothetical protein [Meiothermus rufus]